MEYTYLSSTVVIKTIDESARRGIFEVGGLYTGYGLTVGNALRRALLSSLPGAAVTQFKLKNVPHEFSSLSGIKEDMIEFSLNLKSLRFQMHVDEPITLQCKVKGISTLTGADFMIDDRIVVVNPEIHIATLTSKDAELDIEIVVEKGLGYSPVEGRSPQKLPVGVIAIDALFSPVTKANFTIENMRVGARTDYDRLHFEVETDGTLSPSAALHKAANILRDHFQIIGGVTVGEFAVESLSEKKTKKKK